MSPAARALAPVNAARSFVSIAAMAAARSALTVGRSLLAASACFLSIRAWAVSSAAVSVPGSVNSVTPVVREEMVTLRALLSLLAVTWALAFVRTTFVASAPAPATPTPPLPPKLAATLAAVAWERMLAFSVAESVMSPLVELVVVTPVSALIT